MARTLLLLRPADQSAAFARAVEDAFPGRFRIEIAPILRIVATDTPVDLTGIGALAFTSANGVDQFVRKSPQRELPAYCVGDLTAAAAREAGFEAISADGDVHALAALVASRHDPARGACLHVRGIHAAGNLERMLIDAGIPTRSAAIYDQPACPIEMQVSEKLSRGEIDVVTFFSRRTALSFMVQADQLVWPLGGVTFVSLSAAADDAIGHRDVAARCIAEEPTRQGMLNAIGTLSDRGLDQSAIGTESGFSLFQYTASPSIPQNATGARGRSMDEKKNDAAENDTLASGAGSSDTAKGGDTLEPSRDTLSAGAPDDDPIPTSGDESTSDPLVRSDDPFEPEDTRPVDRFGGRDTLAGDDELHRETGPFTRDLARDEPAEHEDEHHEIEQEGSSFASKLLMFLILLIAGAALGIWGAPKVAPLLPSGMAPVAQWLSPGDAGAQAENASRIETLQSELESMTQRLESVSSESLTAADIEAAITQAGTETEGQLQELRNAFGELSDNEGAAQQIAQLQSSIEGQAGELASLKQQLTASGEAVGASAAEIDVYQAELEGLRGEMRTLSDRVASLATRIDEVAATADRSIEEAQARVEEIQQEAENALDAAAIENDVALISAALSNAQPFAEPAQRLQEADNVQLPEGLQAVAEAGVPTVQMLLDDFPPAANSAIRASISESAGDGFLDRSRAFLEAQIATRSLEPQEGQGTDAVLSRVENELRQGNLESVLSEADALPSEAANAMSDWLDAVRKRQAANAGLAELQANLQARN